MLFTKDPKKPGTTIVRFSQEEIERVTTTIPSDTTQIARYMDLNKFYGLITSKSLWFSRVDQFSDEFDGLAVVPPETRAAEYFRKLSFVNCWNEFQHESMALWHSFVGRQRGGVILLSSIDTVLSSIPEGYKEYINPLKVQYVHPEEEYDGINNELLVSRKKIFYIYENEIRFNYSGGGTEDERIGVSIPVCTKTLITELILSPYMPIWMEDTVKDIMKKYELNNIEILRSNVRDNLLR